MMWLWIVIVGVSWAAETPDSVRPVLASTDAPARFVAWQASRGTDERLACEPLLGSEALLCFRTWDGRKRRWVTMADLKAWETTTAQLRDRLGREAAGYLDEMEAKRPVDMPGTYYQLAHGDGWAAAVLLAPDRVCDQLGAAHLLAAAPTDSVVFVWEPGNAELDAAIGIAVKNAFKASKNAVSPVVFYWRNGTWSAYGEAKPRKP